MAVLYTEKQIQAALRELRIQPENGKVTSEEVARIWTWRAKHERGIEHEYPTSAVRRHVEKKNLTAHKRNERFNLYVVEDVFALSLVPKRGIKQMKEKAETS